MKSTLQESIDRQRNILKSWLSSSLSLIAQDCKHAWPQREALEARLIAGLAELPYCKYLYVLDANAQQITANASRAGLIESYYGRDRSHRPYMVEALAGSHLSLSDASTSSTA